MAYLLPEYQYLGGIKLALLQWHSQVGERHLHVSKSWSPARVEVGIKSANGLGKVDLPLEFLDTFYPGLYTKVKKKKDIFKPM